MNYKADSVEDYISQLPEERKPVITKLWSILQENLPQGFDFKLSYGMPGAVIPHSLYEGGYHCSPELPVPFASIASQKNFVALYNSAVYAIPELYDWWVAEYPKHAKRKLDMGKSCIRFKSINNIPYDLIAELCQKVSPQDYLEIYKKADPRNK